MPCPDDTNGKSGQSDALLTRLLKSRTILISGPVEDELTEKIIALALVLDAESHDPIKVILTTPGGSIDLGFAIYDILRFVESDVICIGAGYVASMGVPILLAAKKENRLALPNTRFMMHQPSTGAAGQAKDIRITAQEILKIREKLNRLIAEESGQDFEKVAADSDRDFWITAEEALEYGLIARIVSSTQDIA
ncbi:MAG: ATP-dependent Clp protease proteolytic subunit [Nitrospiraceae bacterium]|nr:ATP-dependent Clp protease proteolytic subunit [Nitrospiraceae bacterium]